MTTKEEVAAYVASYVERQKHLSATSKAALTTYLTEFHGRIEVGEASFRSWGSAGVGPMGLSCLEYSSDTHLVPLLTRIDVLEQQLGATKALLRISEAINKANAVDGGSRRLIDLGGVTDD